MTISNKKKVYITIFIYGRADKMPAGSCIYNSIKVPSTKWPKPLWPLSLSELNVNWQLTTGNCQLATRL